MLKIMTRSFQRKTPEGRVNFFGLLSHLYILNQTIQFPLRVCTSEVIFNVVCLGLIASLPGFWTFDLIVAYGGFFFFFYL